ncbi:MAG: hypothetical protein ACOYLD_14050 [Anaerohalosphaeraceae bacterium]
MWRASGFTGRCCRRHRHN